MHTPWDQAEFLVHEVLKVGLHGLCHIKNTLGRPRLGVTAFHVFEIGTTFIIRLLAALRSLSTSKMLKRASSRVIRFMFVLENCLICSALHIFL